MNSHQLEIRVTYQETDGQRRVHHANYLNYFERGRVEMLREMGVPYRQLEDRGCMLVVREMNVIYHAAAEFDDLLTLTTQVLEVRKVRIRHGYTLVRQSDNALIVEGESVVASVSPEGKPIRIPADLVAAV